MKKIRKLFNLRSFSQSNKKALLLSLMSFSAPESQRETTHVCERSFVTLPVPSHPNSAPAPPQQPLNIPRPR
ncbi:hypothetical protein E2C01_102712 [Portunus trituberculatus]|uniref:Uncharacterized protein n=1 Tax=Portunus trituberculatus TaxID=210409 RepID=A0A5B7KDB7_PORTR|nr:hypothetical protein [Portunus trituberculatus]